MFRPNPDHHLQCAQDHTQDAYDCLHHQVKSYSRQYLRYIVRTRHMLEMEALWGLPQAPTAHQVARLTHAIAHHAYPKLGCNCSSGIASVYASAP